MKKLNIIFITLAILISGYMISKQARTPQRSEYDQAIYDLSNLPVVYGGRVKPYSTLAKNAYRIISERDTFKDLDGNKQTQMHWLMDLLSGHENTYKHQIFRIDNLEVQEQLGLEKRKRYRYAYEEFEKKLPELYKLAGEISNKEADNRTAFENKVLSVVQKIDLFWVLAQTHRMMPVTQKNFDQITAQLENLKQYQMPLAIPPTDYRKEWQSLAHGLFNDMTGKETNELARHFALMILDLGSINTYMDKRTKLLEKENKDAPSTKGKKKKDYSYSANGESTAQKAEEEKANTKKPEQTVAELDQLIKERFEQFNLSLKRYHDAFKEIKDKNIADLKKARTSLAKDLADAQAAVDGSVEKREALMTVKAKVNAEGKKLEQQEQIWLQSIDRMEYETFFNKFDPFFLTWILCIVVFTSTIFSWIFLRKPLNNYALTTNIISLIVCTWGMWARYYISGYPPITNLYSTAIFIGWTALFAGIVIEFITGYGLGNLISSLIGIVCFAIAYFLGGDGDTLEMMRAVLDTKFWLLIHVTVINFGYMANYVAGIVATVFIFHKLFDKSLDRNDERRYAQITYGVICFALLFSFIGTVLGGLWADYSWGRFWGWDPKENGALIIVLWNALILHARWCGWIRNRGLALCALMGNIVTTWSWFGVNQLGVGLHSYGFTDSATFWILVYVSSQIVMISIGSFLPNETKKRTAPQEEAEV